MSHDPARFVAVLGDDGLQHLMDTSRTPAGERALCGARVVSTNFLETTLCPLCQKLAGDAGR